MNSGGGLSGYVIINQFGPSVSSKSFLAHRLIWELFSAVFFTNMARSCLARFLWSRSLLKATKLCHSSSFPAYGGGWTCLSVKGNGTNSGSSSSSSSSSGMSFISKFLSGRVAIVVQVYQQNMPVAVYTKNFLEAGGSWLAKAGRELKKRGDKATEKKHTPEVFPSRQESDFVDSDLIPGGYGSRSLAWPHGQRTPPCYLAQHFECVVEEGSEGWGWWKGTPGRAAGAEEKTEPRSW